MGNRALRWAKNSRGLTPTQKLVLFVLADAAHDDDGVCWNGAASLAEETGLSDRAVRTALHDLIEAGAITGTMRSGVRPRWVLAIVETGTTFLPKRKGVPLSKRNHVPTNRKQVPSKPEPRSVKPEPGSDEPPRTLIEPLLNPKARAKPPAVLVDLPSWLSSEAWDAWCQHRRGPKWTQQAAVLSIRELGKHREAGHDPADVIAHSIASGYRGLFAPNRRGMPSQRAPTASDNRWAACEEIGRAYGGLDDQQPLFDIDATAEVIR